MASRMGTGGAAAAVAALAAVAAVGLGAAPAPADARAPALIHAHQVLSVQCVPGPAGTVRARVRVRMVVVNYDSVPGRDWATEMVLRARLVPTTAGLNFTRSFRQVSTTRLLQNRKYRPVLTVVTDNVSGLRDWDLQVRLVWDRTAPVPNVQRTIRLRFHEGCALPASPGLVSGSP